jgi:hypothetical protein
VQSLCVEKIERVQPPRATPALGVSWNPAAQLQGYQLKGPYIIDPVVNEWNLILPANPSRMAWYFQTNTVGSPGGFWAGDVLPQFGNLGGSHGPLPTRVTAVDWPGLCQQSWYFYTLNTDQLFVFELVSNT